MNFAAATAAARRRAPMIVRLKPSAWADTWEGKDTAPSEVGIRFVSELDAARARGEAERVADDLHPKGRTVSRGQFVLSDQWVDAYNQVLMHFMIAAALCRADDVTEPLFEMQEFVISHKLSSAGTLRLYDAIIELGIVDSPLTPEISLDGCEALAKNITREGWWARLEKKKSQQIARLLQRVVEIAG